jgi:hypothetical protein
MLPGWWLDNQHSMLSSCSRCGLLLHAQAFRRPFKRFFKGPLKGLFINKGLSKAFKTFKRGLIAVLAMAGDGSELKPAQPGLLGGAVQPTQASSQGGAAELPPPPPPAAPAGGQAVVAAGETPTRSSAAPGPKKRGVPPGSKGCWDVLAYMLSPK